MTPREGALALVVAASRAGTLRVARAEGPLHAAADAHLTRVTAAVLAAFRVGQRAWRRTRDAQAAALAVRKALGQTLPPALLAVAASGHKVAVGRLRSAQLRALADDEDDPSIAIAFDVSDQRAVAWAQEHAGEAIDDISDTTEQAIQDAIADALDGGQTIDEASDDIADAIGDEDRADMIARTEIMTAANEGQQMGWEDAVDAGLLPGDAQVEWITTSGASCDDCADMDGETRDVNGEYDDADYADGPPAHPNCRCTEGIVEGD